MPAEGEVMVSFHDHNLVALSVLISILAAFAAQDLCERVRDARGWTWVAWLLSGATASGICIWSMHYTAMQAYTLPIPVHYDWPTVLLSLFVGIGGSAAALLVLSSKIIGWVRVLAASIFYGAIGISGLHYTAMAAMRLKGVQHHSHVLMILSIVMAIVVSFMALALMFFPRQKTQNRSWLKRVSGPLSALLLGLANPVLHYIAMAGLTVTYSDRQPDLSHALNISSPAVFGLGIVPVMVLIVALLTSLEDRLRTQSALLDELFEQAPLAVALMSADNRVIRVNREFSQLFGYGRDEIHGRHIDGLIVPDDLRDEERRFAEMATSGQRVDVEVARQRKDGSRLHVCMVRVPVSVPDGQIEIYAIFHDVTERKQAQEAQRKSTESLQSLSRRLVEVQEAERRHLSRELHDEFGQILATITLQLHAARSLAGEVARVRLDECAKLLQQAGEQVRNLSFELRPTMLDTVGLEATLRWLAEQHQERTGCVTQVVGHLSGAPLSPELATACFRVVQEALTNIVRHASACHVWIELSQNDNMVDLVIRDDGVGFDVIQTQEQAAKRGSFGLLGMRERIQIFWGRLDVVSEPGLGTSIRASFPLSEASEQPAKPEE